jgi:hypothetical protein
MAKRGKGLNSPGAADWLRLLHQVREGKLEPEAALEQFNRLTVEVTAFAHIDHHRPLRVGVPEAIFCPGKTLVQVIDLVGRLVRAGSTALATRAPEPWGDELLRRYPSGEWHADGRVFLLRPSGRKAPRGRARLWVVSAGTADQQVATEAAVSAEACGFKVGRIADVGVAGLHRLLAHGGKLRKAEVIIVVAGMDGALPSVVGGLVAAPVIAVPTSVGYGASFGGVAALLTMLNSCAPGVVTVNIDNGYGAAVAACKILGRP